VEMMARVSTSNNLYLIQTGQTILRNNGQYSSLYRLETDPWK
jgi:hypothetical protein